MPKLPDEDRAKAILILDKLRLDLQEASAGNEELLFSMKRYIAKRLEFDERGTPTQRRKLKEQKLKSQQGLCAGCNNKLPERGAELDRFRAIEGYTAQNTQLLCQTCHRSTQEARDSDAQKSSTELPDV
jgi:hypothetical protein